MINIFERLQMDRLGNVTTDTDIWLSVVQITIKTTLEYEVISDRDRILDTQETRVIG